MSINADTFIDRLILKAQIRKWRILAIMFATIALLTAVSGHLPHVKQDDYIARVTLDGIIGDDQKTYDLIDSLIEDKKAKAVVVWLDTPGGSAVGGEETFLRLRTLSAHKPVVTVMRSVAASAGYMVALGTDRIFAREGTITGSIGVILETAEITELAEKLGIKPIAIKSSPLKAAPSPFEKSTPEAERVLKDMIMDFYSRFVDMVVERRGLPRDKVLALADGRVYSGRRAVENKLVDAIGGEAEAVDWMVKNRHLEAGLPVDDVEIEPETTLADRILQGTIGNFWQKSRVGLDGLAAIWHPQLH